MAKDYAKVLNALGKDYIVIGRRETNCASFEKEYGKIAIRGGLEKYLQTKPVMPEAVIVAAGIEALAETTMQLLNYGVQYILLEKPGVGYSSEIAPMVTLATQKQATVVLAYNRRFYGSVLKAEEIIGKDGGVTSFNFEFTEWSHVIRTLEKHHVEHHNWFLGNSTHIVDIAFFLGGKPKELSAYFKGSLDWHPSSSSFAGAGISEKGALFSYHANWEAPGRWVMEILTSKHRLLFKPIETLQIQKIGSVTVEPVELNNRLDTEFKPGLYLQAEAFLKKDLSRFCTLVEQADTIKHFYLPMSGYTK